MACLTDGEVQSVVDGEAGAGERAHAASCEACAARVRQQQATLERLLALRAGRESMPEGVEARLKDALGGQAPVRGSTTLRGEPSPSRSWVRIGWRAGLAAAAAVVLILLVGPAINGPATVSAAQVLDKSLQALSRPATAGVEFLEYELTLEGIPREILPDQPNGSYRIQEVIDHDHPGRYRVSSFGPDGGLVAAASEDPAAGTRRSTLRVDGRPFLFSFTTTPERTISMLDLERMHLEASVALMQASSDQRLSEVDDASGKYYRIQIPRVSTSRTAAIWDLEEARVLIDAGDFRIKEFAARGTLLKQPYSVSYTLIRREVRPAADVKPAEFDIPAQPEAIVLEGEGTANAGRDMLVAALSELAKTRR